MTTVPTTAVTSTGITSPAYSDVLSALQLLFQSIYGSDIYIDPDSQDGQLIAIFASIINDLNSLAVAVFNAFSPATAQGAGLSSVVKINGLARLVSSQSTATVTIVGQPGTTINNGLIGDDLGLNTQWSIPNGTLIPVGGSISVLATCTQQGNVAVQAGHLTKILTPTNGWQSVTNPADAVEGAPVETDLALRSRQAISTSLPALSVMDSILAGIGNLTGVLRVTGYDNDQSSTDINGIPGHSISIVVEGGDPIAIAMVISQKKTPGTGTYGTTSEVITDAYGIPTTINFFDLSDVTVSTLISLHNLTGFTTATETLIQQAVSQFINDFNIGDDSFIGRLWSPANLSGDAATTGTGQSQTALDAFSKTYNLLGVYQARPSMTITGGPYVAGSVNINVSSGAGADYATGDKVAVILDDNSVLFTSLANVSGDLLVLNDAIPVGRSANNGSFIYVTGDLVIAFNEAGVSQTTDVRINVS